MNPSKKPQPPARGARLGPGAAVVLGHLFATLPAVLFIVGGSRLGQVAAPNLVFVFLIAGFIIAWVWYAIAISRWRRWALRHVADPAQLQKYAAMTGLLWPKGSPYEKREFRDRK